MAACNWAQVCRIIAGTHRGSVEVSSVESSTRPPGRASFLRLRAAVARRDDAWMLNPILVALFGASLLSLGSTPVPHPHVPKAIVLGGAAGKVAIMYFTVPFNAEHLKDLKDGFVWHLGFAELDSEVALEAGGTKIPKGHYGLSARYTAGKTAADGAWSARLVEWNLAQASNRMRRARTDEEKATVQAAIDAAKAKLKEAGCPEEILLPLTKVDAKHDEHLTMRVEHSGYTSVARGKLEPEGGVEFTLRFSFGDLHREVALKETFAAPAKAAK